MLRPSFLSGHTSHHIYIAIWFFEFLPVDMAIRPRNIDKNNMFWSLISILGRHNADERELMANHASRLEETPLFVWLTAICRAVL